MSDDADLQWAQDVLDGKVEVPRALSVTSQSDKYADLDAQPFHHPDEPAPTLSGAVGRKRCRRHDWVRQFVGIGYDGPEVTACFNCGTVKDEARSRRGKSSRNRGNARERELAAALGGKRTGMYGGPDDVTTDRLTIQSKVRKAFPSWMTAELDKLPRTGGRVPILVVTDSPGHGTRRSIVVLSLADFRDLYGPVPE